MPTDITQDGIQYRVFFDEEGPHQNTDTVHVHHYHGLSLVGRLEIDHDCESACVVAAEGDRHPVDYWEVAEATASEAARIVLANCQ